VYDSPFTRTMRWLTMKDRRTALWISWIGWLLVGGSFLALQAACAGRWMFWFADTFQYLSVAENLLGGRGIATSIILFDEQYHTGSLPAPQTVFPPGYPAIVATIGSVGVPLPTAAYAVSVASFAVLLLLVILAGRRFGFSREAAWTSVFLCVANSSLWEPAASLVTESLFTTVAFAAILILGYAEAKPWAAAKYFRLLMFGSLLAAATYWIRYAGLFLLVGVGAYYGGRLCLLRNRRALSALLLFGGVAAASALIGFARNYAIMGSWMGGNTKPVHHSLTSTAYAFSVGLIQIVFGRHFGPANLKSFDAVSVLAMVAVLLTGILFLTLVVTAFRHRRSSWFAKLREPVPLLLLSVLFVYGGLIFYAGRNSSISLGWRMLAPMVPVLALAVGYLFPAKADSHDGANSLLRHRKWLFAALATYALGHVLLQSHHFLHPLEADEWTLTQAALSTPVSPNQDVRAWVRENVPRDEPVMVLGWQGVGYFLERGAVHLSEADYSQYAWDETRFQQTIKQYHCSCFLIVPQSYPCRLLAQESPFVAEILQGHLPSWMRPVVDSHTCKLFQIRRAGEKKVRAVPSG
jgi:hypothetical protein